ncbi:hypothetical protein EVA_11985 [gut metagenome]|uniref:Uncharacterized protein n=1 Tax=gut metagenome TaxID=749906 RepID=J9FZA1_9ZZZZ
MSCLPAIAFSLHQDCSNTLLQVRPNMQLREPWFR